MSEEGFVRFAVSLYALDEALEGRKKELEEEEEEERKKRLRDTEEEEDVEPCVTKRRRVSNPKRVVSIVREPDPRLVMDPALNALLTKPR
jgi:hypothetical protein